MKEYFCAVLIFDSYFKIGNSIIFNTKFNIVSYESLRQMLFFELNVIVCCIISPFKVDLNLFA